MTGRLLPALLLCLLPACPAFVSDDYTFSDDSGGGGTQDGGSSGLATGGSAGNDEGGSAGIAAGGSAGIAAGGSGGSGGIAAGGSGGIAAGGSGGTEPSLDDCDASVEVGGDVFWICSTPATFDEAVSLCASFGGHLAKITLQAQNSAIAAQLPPATTIHGFWIGATDRTVEGTWQWLDGVTFLVNGMPVGGSYSAWGVTQLGDSTVEDCLTLFNDGTWHDYGCDTKRGFICQIAAN